MYKDTRSRISIRPKAQMIIKITKKGVITMLTDNLCAIYNDIYGRPLIPTKKECHTKMQAAIYSYRKWA